MNFLTREGHSTISAGLAIVNSNLSNWGTLDWTGGTFSDNLNFYNVSGATLNLNGGSNTASFGDDPVSDGTINWSSGDVTFHDSLLNNGDLILNGGANTFTLADGALTTCGTGFEWYGGNVMISSLYLDADSLVVGSVLLDGGSNTFTVQDTLVNNESDVTWYSGDVTYAGSSIFSTGTLTLDGGSNTFTLDGSDYLDYYGGGITWTSGNVTFKNGAQLASGATGYSVTVPTGYTLDISGDFSLSNLLLINTGTLNWNTDNLTLNNAGIENSGSGTSTITVDESSTLNISGSFYLSDIAIENNGILNWDSTDLMAGLTNNATLNFSGTDTSILTDLTNNGTVIFQDPVALISLTGSSSATEGSAYTLTLGSVSSDIPDTITDYIVDWGDGIGLDDFDSAGAKSYTYGGAPTIRTITRSPSTSSEKTAPISSLPLNPSPSPTASKPPPSTASPPAAPTATSSPGPTTPPPPITTKSKPNSTAAATISTSHPSPPAAPAINSTAMVFFPITPTLKSGPPS